MDIQVRTDHTVEGTEGLIGSVESEVAAGLEPFTDRITRVNVHLGDQSGGRRREADIRCVIEAHPVGHEPVVVTHRATTTDAATTGAARQMHDLLARMFGRQNERHPGAPTIRGHQG